MIFHQLFEKESSTYTYLLGCEDTREAVLIDSVLETIDRDLGLLRDLELKLICVLDTHVHADHVTAAGEIRKRLGIQTGVSAGAHVDCADLRLQEGDEIRFGNQKLTALATPGHTDSCMSFLARDRVFTGDALLIRGCGRTDFQQGSPDKLFESVHQKLFTLPDSTLVYPAHDYKGFTRSTIGTEKIRNPRLGGGKTKAEFIKIMNELKLPDPKAMAAAVPLNLGCGIKSV